jgi:predicted nucleic acid-binding protein
MNRIRQISVFIPDIPEYVQFERDPKDAKYINLAIAAKADYLVTRDRDLLDLESEEQQKTMQAIRSHWPDFKVIEPLPILSLLRATQSN